MDRIKPFEPIFGEWYAESFIGAGSFGRVYKIYREELGNRFYSALKYISIPSDSGEITQLRSDGMDNESISTYYADMAKDISSEITLMNKLRGNSNIVSFEDSKIVPKPDGMGYDIFIRMELLQSLTARMVDSPLSREETVRLGIDICNALVRCKKNGIIHRDIKPDNIFISPDGDFKLGDFGIARQLEKTATFMSKKGTYNYMAPEVYKGEKYGATCDLYSLGLVMYRLLNRSRLPFLPTAANRITANDREEALRRRFTGEALPAPCDADDALSEIVLKACAYEPKDRFTSAAEMKEALLRYNRGEYVPETVPAEPASEDEGEKTRGLFDGLNGLAAGAGAGTKTPDSDRTTNILPEKGAKDNKTVLIDQQPGKENAPQSGQENKPQEKSEKAKPTPAKAETQKPENNEKKKRVLWIAGIAAVLALAVGLCAALGVFGNNSKLPDDKAAMNDPTNAPDAVETPVIGRTPAPTDDYFENLTAEPTEVVTEWVTEAITPTDTPEITPTPEATITPTPEATVTPTPVVTVTPTPVVTVTPTPVVTVTPTPVVTVTPTPVVTVTPTPEPTPDPDPVVHFSDPTFEAAFRNRYGVSGTIHESDLIAFTELDLSICGLTDISDVSKFRNLTVLYLYHNNISNISPLAGLTKLTELYLYINNISNISPLAGLTNLTVLYLSGNNISDISPLAWLTKLTLLVLNNNNISNISPLAGLTKLTKLYLSANPLTDDQIAWLRQQLPNCDIQW